MEKCHVCEKPENNIVGTLNFCGQCDEHTCDKDSLHCLSCDVRSCCPKCTKICPHCKGKTSKSGEL